MKQYSKDDLTYIMKAVVPVSELTQISYIEISKVGNSVDLLDILIELRRRKLNFIVSAVNRLSILDGIPMQSYILGIQNRHELQRLIYSLRKHRGKLKIQDAICPIQEIKSDVKMRLTLPPADVLVRNENLLPQCIEFTKNSNYQEYLPTECLLEILQELKVKNALDKINGICITFNVSTRTIGEKGLIRFSSREDEQFLIQILRELGNENVETMLEKQILVSIEIWSQAFKMNNVENNPAYILSHNLVECDLLTNGRDIYSFLNRLGPRVGNSSIGS